MTPMRMILIFLLVVTVSVVGIYALKGANKKLVQSGVTSGAFSTDPGAISVSSIASGGTVPSTFNLAGTAYAAWFFESSFPIDVIAPDGRILFSGHASTNEDWTQEKEIHFESTVDVGEYRGPAKVVLMRDNPSGDPLYDKRVEIPVNIQ